jgi:hypothetical protein
LFLPCLPPQLRVVLLCFLLGFLLFLEPLCLFLLGSQLDLVSPFSTGVCSYFFSLLLVPILHH